MLEKLRLTKFFCCCNVRTGSLIIGVLGWMGSLLNSIALSQPTQVTTVKTDEEGNNLIVEEHSSSNVGTILLSIFMFGVSVSLVWGIYNNNRRYILPWLIIKFLECCAYTIATIVLFFFLFVFEQVGILFIIFSIVTVFTALFWYSWICVWSLYMDMGETTMPIRPMGFSMPMTEPSKQYPPDDINPPQQMV